MMPQDLSQRITILETKVPYLTDELNFLSNQIKDLDIKLDVLNTNVALLIDQRDTARTSLGRWKTAAITVCSGIAIALICFLARISWMVQSSLAASGTTLSN